MDIFDLHCDTITECFTNKLSLLENNIDLDLKRGKNFKYWVQVFAVWIDDIYKGDNAFEYFLNSREYFLNEVSKHSDSIVLYKTGKDLIENCCNAILSIEGGHVLGGDISKVKKIYDLGVRFLTLVWNGDNEIGSGIKGSGDGLSGFGKDLVLELENYGIIIDISHLNQNGVDDVMSLAKRPLVATHSNAIDICSHKRNLNNEQINYLIKTKGLCGINFYPTFLTDEATCEFINIHSHIEHFLSLGGKDILSLGSDFDGAPMPYFLKGIESLELLYDNIVNWYGDNIAKKIFFENAMIFTKNNIVI